MPRGPLWERLAEAEEALAEATRKAKAALAAGDTGDAEEQRACAFELETAVLARDNARRAVGDEFLLLFRCALETDWPDVFGLVMAAAVKADWRKGVEEFLGREPAAVMFWLDRFTEQEKRIEELGRENWELAKELARLKLRVEELEGVGNGRAAVTH